jgi:hypothetical protein
MSPVTNKKIKCWNQVVVQQVDDRLLQDGMYPTVADGRFDLWMQGLNAGLLQVGKKSPKLSLIQKQK